MIVKLKNNLGEIYSKARSGLSFVNWYMAKKGLSDQWFSQHNPLS